MTNSRVQFAEQLIGEFAARTGITRCGRDPSRRYLWTDSFAVFAMLALHRHTHKRAYLDWALRLVELVHHVLGRHRADDSRKGWISGLSEPEGEQRPTAAGLRIGKPLAERPPNAAEELFDERREWDRDGQYFHYLTKWMHALNRVNEATGNARFNLQAIDLAKAAHRAFVYQPRADAAK